MNRALVRTVATLEVVVVLAFARLAISALAVSPLGEWQARTLQWPFAENFLWIAVPALLLTATRRDFAAYGISFRNLKYQVSVALTCYLPVAVSWVPSVALDPRRWDGALVGAAVSAGLLVYLGQSLRKKLDPAGGLIAILISVVIPGAPGVWRSSMPGIGSAVLGFVFFFALVGFGEEIMFRGYIQTRLNEAFGRPYRFFDVEWGWGIVVASACITTVDGSGALAYNRP